jgi:hypothetical protein
MLLLDHHGDNKLTFSYGFGLGAGPNWIQVFHEKESEIKFGSLKKTGDLKKTKKTTRDLL